jgi:hypothetical protein
MVYGGAACGERVMTASSSPGISLKQEGLSYIAEAELPCLVVNPYRPFAESLEAIRELAQGLEAAGRLKFTGIVSNPNLLEETTGEVIREGHRQVEEYGRAFGLPIRRLGVREPFYTELYPEYGRLLLKIDLFLRPGYLNV